MIDRAIGIFGISLSVMTFVLPNYFPKLPSEFWTVSLIFGSVLTGIGIAFIISGGIPIKRKTAKTASLRLHMFGDHRPPDRLESENIFRWYCIYNLFNNVSPQGFSSTIVSTILFLSFDYDVSISTLKISSPDISLPIHEVKEFNQRFAIIVFSGEIPMGTVEVRVSM